MMAPEYRLTELAMDDIAQIHQHISQENPSAADRLVEAMFQSFELLAENPEIGPLCSEVKLKPTRLFVVGNYVIFYQVSTRAVEIYRILHGARNIDFILQ